MTDLSWPSNVPNPMDFRIEPIDHVVGDQSPYTFAREVMHRAHQWHATITWNHIDNADAWRLMAHFARGRGGLNIFEIPIFSYREKVGTKTGSVTLNGAHAAGATSLTIAGGSGAFSAGDWIWITENGIRYAYAIVADEATSIIEISPGLRSARSGGTTLNHFAGGLIYDTMELPPDPTFPTSMPSPSPGFFQPFTVELVTALRG